MLVLRDRYGKEWVCIKCKIIWLMNSIDILLMGISVSSESIICNIIEKLRVNKVRIKRVSNNMFNEMISFM